MLDASNDNFASLEEAAIDRWKRACGEVMWIEDAERRRSIQRRADRAKERELEQLDEARRLGCSLFDVKLRGIDAGREDRAAFDARVAEEQASLAGPARCGIIDDADHKALAESVYGRRCKL